MALKKTSESGLVLEHSSSPPWATLADFDIDGATMKAHHEKWLDEVLIHAINSKAAISRKGIWIIDLLGRASSSGGDIHNLHLSEKRLHAVRAYIESHARMMVRFNEQPLGEQAPKVPGLYESELDRSVEVKAHFAAFEPKPRRKASRLLFQKYVVWKPAKNRKVEDFTLRVLNTQLRIEYGEVKWSYLSGKIGKASVKLFIEIRELGTSDKALYEFKGEGSGGILSGTWSPLPGGGLDVWSREFKDGKKQPFASRIKMDADDFGPAASFSSNLLTEGFKLSFGPRQALFGGLFELNPVSLGSPGDPPKSLSIEKLTVTGKMTLVTSAPSWVK